MQQLIVTANLLNQRSHVPSSLPDTTGIVGTVNKGYSFLGELAAPEDVPDSSLGSWYKDRDGNFYWGGGLVANDITAPSDAPITTILNPDKKDWGFINFNIDQLWNLSKGASVKVAILDTGLNSVLPDFSSNTNISYFNAFRPSQNRDDCTDVPAGHGTDCSAILCGQGKGLWGVAPGIELLVIKISDPNGARSNQAVLDGLDKAIEFGADVVSMSFGIGLVTEDPTSQPYIDALHQKIIAAHSKNITLVASVSDGNLNIPVDVFPASFPECLGIGAISNNLMQASNQSNFLDLMGPGGNVFSLTNPLKLKSGSSFSTPFIAGVIAILKSISKNKNQSLSNNQLFDILKRSANINIPGYNKLQYGWGIVDPVAALSLMQIV